MPPYSKSREPPAAMASRASRCPYLIAYLVALLLSLPAAAECPPGRVRLAPTANCTLVSPGESSHNLEVATTRSSTYEGAEAKCEAINGVLAVLDSPEANGMAGFAVNHHAPVTTMDPSNPSKFVQWRYQAWFALRKFRVGWLWPNGTAPTAPGAFLGWCPGQPDMDARQNKQYNYHAVLDANHSVKTNEGKPCWATISPENSRVFPKTDYAVVCEVPRALNSLGYKEGTVSLVPGAKVGGPGWLDKRKLKTNPRF